MNAGVSTSPCAVVSTPARAAPSVAVTRKALMTDMSSARPDSPRRDVTGDSPRRWRDGTVR